MSRKKENKSLKRKARQRQVQSAIDATRRTASPAHPSVSVRRAAAPESYATAHNRAEHEEALGRVVQEMRTERAAWQPGPEASVEAWVTLPEIPLENRRHPSVAHYVVDLFHFECSLADVLAHKLV